LNRVHEAAEILAALGLPGAQRNERSALTLLALAGIRPRDAWPQAKVSLLRIWDIMGFMRKHYGKDYAANTRETIRRQTIHQFEQARIVDRNPDDPARPTNSGKTVYGLTPAVLNVVRVYGTARFETEVACFLRQFPALQARYRRSRALPRVPLRIPGGAKVRLSPGAHNRLQVAVIEQFGPRFAAGASVLYFGDTACKHIVCETEQLTSLRVAITQHDKLPDIVLYSPERNWLFLIEAVTSHGPMSPKRRQEIETLLVGCPAERVYVTAFPDVATFRKHAGDIAWETEVWIADNPDHMIHFNGPKFLGPYAP